MSYNQNQKDKILDEIFRLIADEGLSTRKAVTKHGSIKRETFYQWIDDDEQKSDQYARACEDRADEMFDEIIEIADDQRGDVYIDKDGHEQTDHNVIARSKLKVDARKWALSKMQPTKYGDRNTTVLEGGEKTIEISFEA